MAIKGPILTAVTLLILTSFCYFFIRLRAARYRIKAYRKRGLPVAPNHNFFFGHLLYIHSLIGGLPKSGHYQYAFAEIARQHFMDQGVYYLDLWPVSGVILVVVSPNSCNQVTQTNPNLSMERPLLLRRFFKPIAGGSNLFDLPEKEWKPWRAIFSRGFSAEHSVSLVPGMIQESRYYSETLRNLAKKQEMFLLDDITLRYAMDLVGRAIWNSHLGAQTGYNVLADCMLSQIRWHKSADGVNPLENFNLVRWYMEWWNGREMDRYVGDELDKRYDDFTRPELSDEKRGKSVIDLVFQAYTAEDDAPEPGAKLAPDLRAFAIRQVRLFMFSGHNSTSSTICYCLHLLSTNPETLRTIREEHDTIFGELSATASILESQPNLINSLPYTTAVIKETLRLFPPASASRFGKANQSVTDDQGNVCPTDDAMLFMLHLATHRSSKYWVRVDEFLPERWMVDLEHELYPMKGAWRPFEIGPRNCIAQALAMTTIRVVLVCIVREFDFKPAYHEWDMLHSRKGAKTCMGERAYQIESGAAHPVEHYPCRVSLSKRK